MRETPTTRPAMMIDIPGAAFAYLTGTGAYQDVAFGKEPDFSADPVKNAAAMSMGLALVNAVRRKAGKGESYRVTLSDAAADVLYFYCDTCPALSPERGFGQDSSERTEAAAVRKVMARIKQARIVGPIENEPLPDLD